jgi:hypothetical protein
MPNLLVAKSIGAAAGKVPGLRRIPVLKLVAVAEVGILAHTHLMRLESGERRRLFALLRTARGRPSKLTERERYELAVLVAKLEPRLLAGEAANRLSPFPLPRRVVRGPRRKRRPRPV